jgi:hypothetical protein
MSFGSKLDNGRRPKHFDSCEKVAVAVNVGRRIGMAGSAGLLKCLSR